VADLPRLDVHEGDDFDPPAPEFAGERLPDRSGAPDDDALMAVQEGLAQVVDHAAGEGTLRIDGVRTRGAPGVLAPAKHGLLHVSKAHALGPEAEDEVVVFGPAPVSIAAHRLERVPSDEQSRVRKRAFDEHVAGGLVRAHQPVDPALVAAGAGTHPLLGEVRNPAAAGRQSLVLQRVDLCIQPLRERDIVAVHAGEQTPARL
jgi:hypothetical protein